MRLLVACLVVLCPTVAAQSLRITIPLDGSVGPALLRLDARAKAELGAVVLTGVGHLVAAEAGVTGAYLPAVVVGWGGYVGYRTATEPGYLRELGFSGEKLGRAARDVGFLSAGAVVVMAAYGATRGSLRVDQELGVLLLLYPAWGLTQQMLVQGYVTRHLDAAGLSLLAVTPISAVAFGSVHVPNWPLAGATTVMGGTFAPLYLRDRNLWPLGVAHGVLGGLFYTWVLECDAIDQLRGTECE